MKSAAVICLLLLTLTSLGCAATSAYDHMTSDQLKAELAKEKAQVDKKALEIYTGRGFFGSACSGAVASQRVKVIEAEIKARGESVP